MSKRKSSDTVEKLQESVSDVIPEGEKTQRKRVVNDESRTSEQARWSKNEDQEKKTYERFHKDTFNIVVDIIIGVLLLAKKEEILNVNEYI